MAVQCVPCGLAVTRLVPVQDDGHAAVGQPAVTAVASGTILAVATSPFAPPLST